MRRTFYKWEWIPKMRRGFVLVRDREYIGLYIGGAYARGQPFDL